MLWLGAGNNPTSSTLFGYAPATVAATGSVPATVAANTFGSDGFTFDPWGNLWVIGGTTADEQIARYPAAQFATGGAKTPDIVINGVSSSIPGPKVLAFDIAGNLWVSVVADNKVVKFTADDLSETVPTASVELTGIDAPAGLAFDFDGNLWVAANGSSTIMRIDANQLAASGSGADLTITAETPSPVIGTLGNPLGIAFDGDDLWVNYDGILARLTPADLTGVGTKTVTPHHPDRPRRPGAARGHRVRRDRRAVDGLLGRQVRAPRGQPAHDFGRRRAADRRHQRRHRLGGVVRHLPGPVLHAAGARPALTTGPGARARATCRHHDGSR